MMGLAHLGGVGAKAPALSLAEAGRTLAEPVLDIRNLVVRAGSANLVDGVSLAVRPGETLCLVGESGCGKSLTCMSALGLLDDGLVSSASVRLFGEETIGAPERAQNSLR